MKNHARLRLAIWGAAMSATLLVSVSLATPALADGSGVAARYDLALAQVHSKAPKVSTNPNPGSGGLSMPQSHVASDGVAVHWPDLRTTKITLPKQGRKSRVVSPSRDGESVYLDSDVAGESYVVQDSGTSTRIVAVIATPATKHALDFGMDGFAPIVLADGSAIFVSGDGMAVPVSTPWAKDSSGASLETRYVVHGDRLVQEIVPGRNAQYPIVADPQWVWWSAAFGLKFSRTETSNMRDWGVAAGMCLAFIKTPATAGICGAWVSYAVFQAALAEQDSPRRCLFAVVVPIPGAIYRIGC